MSGGSFDYLFGKDLDDLMWIPDELVHMSEELKELGYAEDAATATQEFIDAIRAFRNKMDPRLNQLKPIWKAVEYWRSNDWSEDSIKQELEEYRVRNRLQKLKGE